MIAAATSQGTSLLLVETALTALILAVAIGWPSKSKYTTGVAKGVLSGFVRRPWLCVICIGVAEFLLRLLILPFCPIPKPYTLPDFSFLLAADTFASGRLTNPPHPMWMHFETFHISFIPTYMSMYFPAQGLLIALGTVLTGVAWFGVLASAALMCGALCWMLQAWLPPRWALLGGFLAVLRLGLFSYWIDTYGGGSIAAFGGALVAGALPRIWRKLRTPDFFWLSLGLSVLAISRAYEGLLLSAPAVGVLIWKIRQNPHAQFDTVLRRAIPGIVLLSATLAFIGYYDRTVFGNVFTLPYTLNRRSYAAAPYFLWQHARPEPIYNHAVMRDFYIGWELRQFLNSHTQWGFVIATVIKAVTTAMFYLGVIFLVPMTMLPRVFKDRRTRPLVLIALVFSLGIVVETFLVPHYIAPLTAIIYAILLQCMRHMRTWRLGDRRVGEFMMRAIPVTCVLLCILRINAGSLNLALAPAQYSSRAWFGTFPFGQERDAIAKRLENLPGKQLVFVRYSPGHEVLNEWVYNAADIDHSKVVWAREMGTGANAELVHYFADRKIWFVEPDLKPVKISSYPGR